MSTRGLAILLIAACSSSKGDQPPPTPTPPPPADAAIDGITSIGTPDPGAHLDDDPSMPLPTRPTNKRPGRQIEILLRSSPPGATASVDGLAVGITPTYWVGETGAEHEFTFRLPKHALARYKFFPITTGTVHARLEPVANDVDAGVPPPGLVGPSPIPPPETLVSPVPQVTPDAAPAPIVIDAAPIAPTPIIDAAPATGSSAGPSIGPTP